MNITIRILSTKSLPNSTYLDVKQAIESRANHPIKSLVLEVILFQDFTTLTYNHVKLTQLIVHSQTKNSLARRFILG